MADKQYKRLDKDNLDYLAILLLTKLKGSPLNNNTTYTFTQDTTDANKIVITSSDGTSTTLAIPAYDDTAVKADIAKKANIADLSTVATSGNYADLSGLPTIPTVPANVGAFTNDKGYQTADDVSTAISNAMKSITSVTFQPVTSFTNLPATGTAGVIYLVPDANASTAAHNIYVEYFWDTSKNAYEQFGPQIDLSGYVKADQMETLTNDEIEAAVNAAYTSVFGS